MDPSGSSQVASRVASSVHDVNAEKPPFGARFLTEGADVWSQNAWDHVPPPEGQEETIADALAKQHLSPVPDEDKPRYNDRPARHWDNFYKMNSSNFFRNRKWLHLEFPELLEAAQPEKGPMSVVEIGCGAGNAVFPLLSANKNSQLDLRAYDYSAQAVKLVQTNPLYQSPPIGTIQAAVWDLSSPELPPDLTPQSVDIIVLVFVLSALHPREWPQAVRNIHKILKPGGLVALRDYGRHDLTQLRFKGGRLLENNFYIRGDKTRVYFFELDELALLFTGSLAPSVWKTHSNRIMVEEEVEGGDHSQVTTPNSERSPTPSSQPTPEPPSATPPYVGQSPREIHETMSDSDATTGKEPEVHPSLIPREDNGDLQLSHPMFTIEQLGVDRRLIVNRKRQLKMYRVWMQGKFRRL